MEIISEEPCKICRRISPHINGLIIAHMKPTGHLCCGCSAEEARHLSTEMERAVSEPGTAIASMQSEPCSFCDRVQETIYPGGKGVVWFAKSQARVCGQCLIMMCESVVGSSQLKLGIEEVSRIDGDAC